jgi:hypothetical protein
VLPIIQETPVAMLAELTGLSRPYWAAILRGERVPHARWWGALRELDAAGRHGLPTPEDRPEHDPEQPVTRR